MDGIVSDHTLWELSRKVGHSWTKLGRCLFFDDASLGNIEMNCRTLQESTYQMLCLWMLRNGRSATYTTLSVALREAGRSDLSQEVLIAASFEKPAYHQSESWTRDSLRSDEEISTKTSAKVTDEQPEKDVSLAGSSSESTSSWKLPMLHRPVDDETLWELCGEISHEWREVGYNLGLEGIQLYSIEVDHTNNIKEAIYTMLKMWKQRNGRDATFRVLGIALVKAGRKDLEVLVYERAYSKNKPSVTDIAMDNVVGIDTLMELSNEIGHAWRNLGRCFGMTEAELSNIEADNYLDRREMIQEMLLLWKTRSGTAATYGRLSEALRMIGRKDLSERYMMEAAHSKNKPSVTVIARDNVVGIDTLMELSNEIVYEWRNLGRCFGITEAELSNIEVDNFREGTKIPYQMLLLWKRRDGTAATYGRLSEALIMIGRKDLSDRYMMEAAAFQDFEEEAKLSPEMTEKNAESDIIQSYNKLQETVTALLTQRDCEQLLDYFKLAKEHYEATQTSDSSSKFLLDILEERGFIHPADVSALLEALRELKINDRALHIVETYDRSKDDETSFETFLAALSAHLMLSIPEKLCNYFKFTDEEKEAVISSKSPGLALTMALERKGYINPFDVGRLLPAFRELHLVQAAAKVEEYQILVEERSDFKTPAKTLKEKERLFIKCVKAKIKSWCEGMTPIPWKKSCQWKVSDLFVTRSLTLANKRMKTKSSPTKPLSYTDIFTHQDLRDESRLIVEGDPGSGKTMLAFQLAYDWSIGNLNDVNMVMILPLKFLQDMTITEAIAKFYRPKDAPLGEDDIKAILNSANERNKTCIVLDGIEEYNHKPKDGKASAVDAVMNKDQLSNCTVLLTSRSDFDHGFRQFPKLKLGQFGEKERGLYIDRIVPEDKERQQKLKKAIQSSDFLRDICSNALLFAFVVHNIEPLVEGDIKDHLERIGPFMQLMVDNLLSATRLAQSKRDTQGMEHSDKLAEIAFNGLCKGQQILMWQKSFLEKKVPDLKMWIESGILVEEENILMRSESKEIKLREEEIEEEMPDSKATDQPEQKTEVQLQHDHKRRDQYLKLEGSQSGVSPEKMKDTRQSASNVSDPRKVSLLVKFLHKVIQEWFAAEHFSSVLKRKILENCHQDFLHGHLRLINPADLHYVLRFTSYLCPFSGHCIMKGLHKVYKGKYGVVPEYVFNCIALCFAEFDSSIEDDNIHNAVRQVLRNAVTIRGEDNRLLQRSKVSMLEYASYLKQQINVRHLSLADVLKKVAQEQVTLNSGIILPWLSNVEAVSVCQWDQKLDEMDCLNLLAFITKCSGIKVAILDLPNPPPVLEDETEISKMKSRKMAINWTNGHVNKTLDVNMNQWKLTSGVTTVLQPKTELGSEGKSSESTKKETKLASKQPEEELRRLKEAVDGERQQLLSRLQATTEELEETKSSLAAAKEELSALQKDFEKTKEALICKENSFSGSVDQQLSQSGPVIVSPSSAELGDDQVKQIIGKEGGLLEISGTGVSLEIPPGALAESQLIEMRIIRQYYLDEPLSFYSNASVIVELLPNHLELQKEAVLTLPHCVVFKEGCEWEAEVYSSHHGTDSQQRLKVNPEIRSSVRERHCVLWLCSFSLWTWIFKGNIAEGKRIILFAAKRKTSTNESMLLDVGFYLKHTDAKQIILSHNVMLYEKEAKLYEEGDLPLRISFEEMEPDHWSFKDEKERLQTLTFEQIGNADCQSCTFRLRGDPSESEDGTCTFKIWQKENECSKLCFHLKDLEKSRYESAAMDRVVSSEDIEKLSKEIGDSWVEIARALQLMKADIENIRDDNKKQKVVAYEILLKWKQTNGNSATYSVLVKALRSAGRKDLGDDLEKKVNDPSAETDTSNEGK